MPFLTEVADVLKTDRWLLKMININATNLHSGGGVQVATSFIGELTLMPYLPSCLVVWASHEVDAKEGVQNTAPVVCDRPRMA